MAGHSQFKNIMFRKGAQDAKRAKIFTKIIREIITAAKSGLPDPKDNPRLRAAIQKAKEQSMPRDKIEAAIKRGTGNVDTDNYEPIRYEGYGPGGVAVIVEALTDNRNRTASEVRATFAKQNGNMGETGSVSFMFDQAGQISYSKAKADEETMLEAAIEAGADNCELNDAQHIITCSVENFGTVRDALEAKFGEPESAKLTWLPKSGSPISGEQAESLLKMLDVLEDNDDVQEVYTNADIPDEIIAKFGT